MVKEQLLIESALYNGLMSADERQCKSVMIVRFLKCLSVKVADMTVSSESDLGWSL